MPVIHLNTEGPRYSGRIPEREGRGAPYARAVITGTAENSPIRGEVRFYECAGGTAVEAKIEGLPTGEGSEMFLGFHIHENGSCADMGGAAGGHYNPEGQEHGHHAGDLPNLLNAGGKADLAVCTDRFTPGQVTGRTVVIHSMPDDYRTQPAGDSGSRIACGVIERRLP